MNKTTDECRPRNHFFVASYLGERDLLSLARSLVNMAGVKEAAEGMELQTELSLEDLSRELTVFVPTDRLEAFLVQIKESGQWHGALDVFTEEALWIAEMVGCEGIVELIGQSIWEER
jgi:hypothetical protein